MSDKEHVAKVHYATKETILELIRDGDLDPRQHCMFVTVCDEDDNISGFEVEQIDQIRRAFNRERKIVVYSIAQLSTSIEVNTKTNEQTEFYGQLIVTRSRDSLTGLVEIVRDGKTVMKSDDLSTIKGGLEHDRKTTTNLFEFEDGYDPTPRH